MNSLNRPTRHPSVRTDFIRLGSVTTNRKNGLAGKQFALATDTRSVSTRPSRMFSVLTEGWHVGYSREFVGTAYCTYWQSNTTIILTIGNSEQHNLMIHVSFRVGRRKNCDTSYVNVEMCPDYNNEMQTMTHSRFRRLISLLDKIHVVTWWLWYFSIKVSPLPLAAKTPIKVYISHTMITLVDHVPQTSW